MKTILWLAVLAGVTRLAYLAWLELRNAGHVWHDPCITPAATRRDINHVIRVFADVANARGLRWWLDYGTLLGAWRIAGMMPFDHDCDVSWLAEDRAIAEQCRADLAGHDIDFDIDGTTLRYRGVKVGDAEMWHRHGDLLCREKDLSVREGLLKRLRRLYDDFPAAWVEPRWEIEYEGSFLPCPHHPERLLLKRYPTCRVHLRLSFPHKQKCWICPDFWRAAWAMFWSRRGPVIRRGPLAPGPENEP